MATTKYLTANPKTSRKKQKGKTKAVKAKPKTSRQNQILHSKNQIPHGKSKYPRQNQSYFVFAVKYLVLPWCFWFCREVFCFCREVFYFCREVFGFAVMFLFSRWGFWFCRDSCGSPYKCSITRGTQLEYSSKLLKHSIVNRVLVLNGRYIYPLKMFHLFAFPSWKSSDPKIITGDQNLPFRNFQPEKGLRKILGDLSRVKTPVKMGNYSIPSSSHPRKL